MFGGGHSLADHSGATRNSSFTMKKKTISEKALEDESWEVFPARKELLIVHCHWCGISFLTGIQVGQ